MQKKINEGKRFEEDFKNSVPSDVWYYRFRDGTGNFQGGKNENVRFQASNIADNQLFYRGTLYVLELKSTKNTSIPYSMIFNKDSKSNMRKKRDLLDASNHNGIVSGYVVNFRKYNRTWFMTSLQLEQFLNDYQHIRSSIPVSFFNENCLIIEQEKKVSRYRYNIKKFINEAIQDNPLQGQTRLFE